MAQPVYFGTAYYPAYHPQTNPESDLGLMADAHMNLIRLGESEWSQWEPAEGQFNLDYLKPALDEAHRRGIKAYIGAPTYAIPTWLERKHPEIALTDADGNRHRFGSREEHSVCHPVFRYYAERLWRRIIEHYRDHPAVMGWQLHNEPGISFDYSPSVFEGFKTWLRQRYGDVETLNRAWGLAFWSNELTDWDDLWEPQGNAQPQYDIEWRQYQRSLVLDMLGWECDVAAELRRDGQIIVDDFDLKRPGLDEVRAARMLDVAGVNVYTSTQRWLAKDDIGPWSLLWRADRAYGLKQAPFFVTETNAGPIGGAANNYPHFDGQLRQVGWQLVARGARAMLYWQWRQTHCGTEIYWGGVLPHDGIPGRIYRQIAQLGDELDRSRDMLEGLTPDADVAVLYSVQSRNALAYEPHVAPNAGDPHRARNPHAYESIIEPFCQGAFDGGHQMRFVYDDQLIDGPDRRCLWAPEAFARQYPVLIAAGLYAADDALLDWLSAYALAGGHLIVGPRTAYADELGRARGEVKPARLSELAQVSYQEFSNITQDIPALNGADGVGSAGSAMALRPRSAATQWVDCLRVDPDARQVRVLAYSDDRFFRQFPLATSTAVGDGQGAVTIVGTVPNRQLAASVIDYATSGRRDPWAALAVGTSLSHSSAVNASGERLHFLFNWGWDPVELDLPACCARVDTPAAHLRSVRLDAWDTAVVVEE